MPNTRLHVAVAVVRDKQNCLLLAKRHPDAHQGGLWEFPGGKVESGETVEQALGRELYEELRLTVIAARPLIRVPHNYSDKRVLLDVWVVTSYDGTPLGAEGQAVKWVSMGELPDYQMPDANLSIARACSLPDKYLITPDPGFGDTEWQDFLSKLERQVVSGISLVQFRAKSLAVARYIELATKVISVCHRNGCRVLLNSDIPAEMLPDADGIHISSAVLLQQQKRPVRSDMLLAASCHNREELLHANAIGCDFAVLGPVKKTSSHPDTVPLGWDTFAQLSDESKIPVYALGGMSPKHLVQAWQHGAQGISAISAFWGSTQE